MTIAIFIPVRREDTKSIYTIKFRTPASWGSSYYILDGRFTGSSWDQSNDRGWISISSSGALSWGISSATMKVGGVTASQNHALELNTDYEIEYTIPSGTYHTVNRLLSRFNNTEEFKGKIYWIKSSLTSDGTRYESKYVFTTLSSSKPTGRLFFKDSGENPYPVIDKTSVKTASGWSNVGGVISKIDSSSNELQLCDNCWGAATSYHVTCFVSGANASTILKYTGSNNVETSVNLVNGFNEFVLSLDKVSHIKVAANNTSFAMSDLKISDGGVCGLYTDDREESIWFAREI